MGVAFRMVLEGACLVFGDILNDRDGHRQGEKAMKVRGVLSLCVPYGLHLLALQ